MNIIKDFAAFIRLVAALEPWLGQVVIVVGWAHQLYRLHPTAQELDYPPLITLDTDVAVPEALPVGQQDIRERLLAYGFTEEFLGNDHPPATHYQLGGDATGFYAEFLTPLIGCEYDRNHKRKATRHVAGIVSQQLRYVEVLLHRPWWIDLYERDGLIARVQVANPVSFLAQKILIHSKRDREHRAKDILYMHDTVEVFGPQLPELKQLWKNIVAPLLNARGVSRVYKAAEVLFDQVTDDVRRAARISPGRELAPEAIMRVCQLGFRQMFM